MSDINKKRVFRTAYDNFKHPGLRNEEPSMTKQSFKDECDVNRIVGKYGMNGPFPTLNHLPPNFGDYSNIKDFQSAQNAVLEAENAFNSMDPNIRAYFENDPGLFVDFVTNPANQEQIYALGLAERPLPDASSPSANPFQPESEDASKNAKKTAASG